MDAEFLCGPFGSSTVMDSSSNSEDEGGLFTSSEILKEMGFSTPTIERATKRSHQSSSGNENHNLKKIKMTSAEEDIVTDSLCYLSTMELQDVSTTLNISDIVDTAVSSCSTTQHQLPDIRNNYFDVQKDTSIADCDLSFDDPNDLDYIPSINSSLIVQSSPLRDQQQILNVEINHQLLEVEINQQPPEVEVIPAATRSGSNPAATRSGSNPAATRSGSKPTRSEPPEEQPVVRNRVRSKIPDKTKWKRNAEKEKRMKGQAY
ncbi:uncharacterized protein LOC124355892 [Homalodisca vitripennis]|uniref:uncharacterized protein LOC124355892 n=1 Tax=Homalodisca vitripennis TaxID=197043 RepID=UPI001EEBF0FE|nr:uncharacterized protein LOC124355892 [Homalodisca vitripennis]